MQQGGGTSNHGNDRKRGNYQTLHDKIRFFALSDLSVEPSFGSRCYRVFIMPKP
jgi:hypothetical protein